MGSLTNKNTGGRKNSSRHYSLYKQRTWHHREPDEAGQIHTAAGKGERVDPSMYAHIEVAALRIP